MPRYCLLAEEADKGEEMITIDVWQVLFCLIAGFLGWVVAAVVARIVGYLEW